ncbi:Hypothetical protein NocV09_05900040 [Nannochloropsis oceanica]
MFAYEKLLATALLLTKAQTKTQRRCDGACSGPGALFGQWEVSKMLTERRRRLLRLLTVALLIHPRGRGHRHQDRKRPRTLQEVFDVFSDDIFLKLHRFTKEQKLYIIPRLHLEVTAQVKGMSIMPSSIVFVMLLGHLAHLHSVSGTMEHVYGYDRTQITKWTNSMLEYLFNVGTERNAPSREDERELLLDGHGINTCRSRRE